jgi:hypothetical protein
MEFTPLTDKPGKMFHCLSYFSCMFRRIAAPRLSPYFRACSALPAWKKMKETAAIGTDAHFSRHPVYQINQFSGKIRQLRYFFIRTGKKRRNLFEINFVKIMIWKK